MKRIVTMGQWRFEYHIVLLEKAVGDFYKPSNYVTIYYNNNLILKKQWLGENETQLTKLAYEVIN